MKINKQDISALIDSGDIIIRNYDHVLGKGSLDGLTVETIINAKIEIKSSVVTLYPTQNCYNGFYWIKCDVTSKTMQPIYSNVKSTMNVYKFLAEVLKLIEIRNYGNRKQCNIE
jgi:hypothetical protein